MPVATYPCTAQMQSIPAVHNHQVSLQCPITAASAVVTNSKRRAFLQRPTAEYPCSAQPHSIPALPMATYPGSAQTHGISAVLTRKVCLLCPALAMLNCSAYAPALPNCNILAVHLQCCKEDSLGEAGKYYISCAITAFGWGCSK